MSERACVRVVTHLHQRVRAKDALKDTGTITTMTTETSLWDFVFSNSPPNKDERLKFEYVYEFMLVMTIRISLFAYILII